MKNKIPVPEHLVSSVTTSSISLSWEESSEMEQTPHSFLVSYQSEGTELNSIPTKARIADITGLKLGTEYTVEVYTVLQHGGKSQPASKKINTEIPVPERLIISSVTTSSIRFSWEESSEMEQTPHSFLVSYQSEETDPKSISTESCSADITGLKPGTEYTVEVYTVLQHGGKSQPASAQMKTDETFITKHMFELEHRLPIPLQPILAMLLREKVLNDSERQELNNKPEGQERNYRLLVMINNKGPGADKVFYEVLKEANLFLVKDLEGGGKSPVSVSEMRLVLLGGSAAGKRAAGNTILGKHTLTHTSTETQHSETREGKVAGRKVMVVDTPDWFCSELSENDMREDVGNCLSLSAPGPHAFLLMIPAEPSEGEERRMLEKMEDIFLGNCWGHTVILFTHAEGVRERSVEELIQTGSQELQQLVEKCGSRCHLLNVKDRPDYTQIKQLLEKIEEMVSGNRNKYFNSETYQEAWRQASVIKRRLQKEQEDRKLREEKQRQEENLKVEREIQQKENEIKQLHEKIQDLNKKMEEEGDEKKKRKLEKELKKEMAQRYMLEGQLTSVIETRDREKGEMEERHRKEMEEMRERYEIEAKAERNLMQIILPELLTNINISKQKMEGEKNTEVEKLTQELRMKNLLIKRLTHILEENGYPLLQSS